MVIKFRKEALQKISSPEQFEALATMTSPKSWLALIAIFILLLFFIGWGFLGNIPTEIDGKGYLVSAAVSSIEAPGVGYVQLAKVKVGDMVHSGQIIARIVSVKDYPRLITLQAKLQQLTLQNNNVAKQSLLQVQRGIAKILQQAEVIVSPYTGIVVELAVRDNVYVKAGQLLLRIEQASEKKAILTTVLFFPPLDGQRIKPGMQAMILPATVKAEEYGYLLGKVTYVSKYPITTWHLMEIIKNKALVDLFTDKSAPIEVHVKLFPSTKNFSGYRWSSSKGPHIHIATGTLCSAKIIVSQRRPIDLLFPSMKGVM